MFRNVIATLAMILITFTSWGQNSIAVECMGEKYREFDFWIGEWEVFTEDRGLVGTNSIRMKAGGCVIQENYFGMQSDYNGTSYNFYDKHSGFWRQVWIDDKGDNLQLSGGIEDGKMVMASDTLLNDDSVSVVHKITWSRNEDASVTQLWEMWKEDTDAWETLFKGEYLQRR